MAWQGVPFKFLESDAGFLNLAVSKLPDLILKSDSDYTNVVITAVVSLVAGIIPAWIAVYTFRRNAKVIKDERVKQHEFLKSEREEQQRFLEFERNQQIASMEADRITQKEIAEKNFNMEVLSSNRQEWINKIRDQMSDYISLAPLLIDAKKNFLICKETLESLMSRPNRSVVEGVNDELKNAMTLLQEYDYKNKKITSHIKLMLNPNEEYYPIIIGVFSEVNNVCYLYKTHGIDSYTDSLSKINEQVYLFTKTSQALLKYEWERVKKGI